MFRQGAKSVQSREERGEGRVILALTHRLGLVRNVRGECVGLRESPALLGGGCYYRTKRVRALGLAAIRLHS